MMKLRNLNIYRCLAKMDEIKINQIQIDENHTHNKQTGK